MSKFDVLIEWDDVNVDTERAWLTRLLSTMRGPEDERIGADDYSRRMAELRKDSCNFEVLNVSIELTPEGLHVFSEDPDGTGKGDVDNACLFIATFLEHWRPQLAVKVVWTSKDAVGRTHRGTHLVGPAGVTTMRAYRQGHRCA